MRQDAVLLLGAGGHARSCIDVIEAEGRYLIAGLIGVQSEVGSKVLGYPVLGTDEELTHLLKKYRYALVTMGQIKSSATRKYLFAQARQQGCELPTIVSPCAYVSLHAQIGEGTLVVHGAVVNPAARIGENCIINTGAVVDHDVIVGDHCHISTGALLNGGVRVGESSFVGSGVMVRQDVVIGRDCVIGIGQRVLVNCEDGTWLPERAKP